MKFDPFEDFNRRLADRRAELGLAPLRSAPQVQNGAMKALVTAAPYAVAIVAAFVIGIRW